MPKTIFKFHTDPGHGWMQVSRLNLTDLGLTPASFSKYSYTDGVDFYLEEDCDMAIFCEAFSAANNCYPDFIDIPLDVTPIRAMDSIHAWKPSTPVKAVFSHRFPALGLVK